MRSLRFSLLFVGMLCHCVLFGQNDPKNLKKNALSLLENGQFQSALALLAPYQENNANDLSILPLLAQAQWGTHQAFKAAQTWNSYINAAKTVEPVEYRELAIAWHHSGHFKEAISNYKKYLNADSKAKDKQYILGCIQRAANGITLQYTAQQMLIENPGLSINSPEEDFKPIPSQIIKGRFYFNSLRAIEIPEGENGVTSKNSNIFQAQNERGIWTDASPLKAPINTPREEILMDFKNQGTILYFQSGADFVHAAIRTDTFRSRANVVKLDPQVIELPYLPETGDRDFVWVNDSSICFASRKLPGFGGFDLFVSQWKDGKWSKPANLGASINTAYDEVAPYVTLNGNTLYFSSNNQSSVGGYDIFFSTYARETQGWSPVDNLGLPINSAGNELWFRLAIDGQEAYFSSDRHDQGFGKSDIYLAYFKKPTDQQTTPGFSFAWIDPLIQGPEPVIIDIASENPRVTNEGQPRSNWTIEPIFLPGGDFVLSELMKQKFQQITSLYRKDPSLKFLIKSYVAEDAAGELDLFFGIRNAEKGAEYMIKAGIPASSILLSSFGANYPIAMPEIAGVPNQTSAYFNNRLDIRAFPTDTNQITFTYISPNVGESLQSKEGVNFEEQNRGLVFRIQFLVSSQMYKGDLFSNNSFRDPYIESAPQSGNYRFMVGFEKRYQPIRSMLNRIKALGYEDAFITAYIDGKKLNIVDINPELLKAYPELRNWTTN